MAIRPILLVSALTCVSVPGVLQAQQIQIQQMEVTGPDAPPFAMAPGRTLRTGTGRIRGRVLSESGAPVRRAQVRICRSRHRRPDRHHRRRRPLRVPRSAGWPVHGQRLQGRLRDGAVRADAAARAGQADRAGRQADARQGRPRDAPRQRHHRPHRRRSGRAGGRRGGHRDAAEWSAGRRRLVNAGRDRPDQRPRPVPDVRPATRRLLRQRHASQPRRARCST